MIIYYFWKIQKVLSFSNFMADKKIIFLILIILHIVTWI